MTGPGAEEKQIARTQLAEYAVACPLLRLGGGQVAPAPKAFFGSHAIERLIERDALPTRQQPGLALQFENGC